MKHRNTLKRLAALLLGLVVACGALSCAGLAETGGAMTVEQLMDPPQVVEMMNRSIEITCVRVAADYDLDADALLEACTLEMSEVLPGVIYFDNPDWSIELYFYFEGVDEPTLDMEPKHWCIAVGERADDPELMRTVAFSATLSMLYMLDPDMDVDAAMEVLNKAEQGGNYEGNGYRFTYLITGNGAETQLMVQRI